jgi:CRP-like cAMP-binding protein
MDIEATLKACALFAKFGESGLALLTKIAEPRSFPAGTPLFVAGMVGEGMFVVQAGEVALELRAGDRVQTLHTLGPGGYFGQLSLLSPGPRLLGARAVATVAALEIPRRNFLKLHQLKPQVGLKLMLAICEDLGQATRDVAPLLLRTVG